MKILMFGGPKDGDEIEVPEAMIKLEASYVVEGGSGTIDIDVVEDGDPVRMRYATDGAPVYYVLVKADEPYSNGNNYAYVFKGAE